MTNSILNNLTVLGLMICVTEFTAVRSSWAQEPVSVPKFLLDVQPDAKILSMAYEGRSKPPTFEIAFESEHEVVRSTITICESIEEAAKTFVDIVGEPSRVLLVRPIPESERGAWDEIEIRTKGGIFRRGLCIVSTNNMKFAKNLGNAMKAISDARIKEELYALVPEEAATETPEPAPRLSRRELLISGLTAILEKDGDPDGVLAEQIAELKKQPDPDEVISSPATNLSDLAVEDYISFLKQSDATWGERAKVISYLQVQKATEAVDVLIEHTSKEQHPHVRIQAVRALSVIGDKGAVPCLVEILNGKPDSAAPSNDILRYVAANGLGRFKDEDGVIQVLTDCQNNPEEYSIVQETARKILQTKAP